MIEAVPLVAGDEWGDEGGRHACHPGHDTFSEGAMAEEIAQQYPSVSLAEVYQVSAYYLRHTSEVDAYLARRREESQEVRRANEARWPPDGIRARLLARRR